VKNTLLLGVTIYFLSAAALSAAAGERWIHVRVASATGVSGTVNVNLPISMASAALPLLPAGQGHQGKFSLQVAVHGADLRALLDATRNSPDNVFITLERHGQEWSVAKSGRNLLIKIEEKPSVEHHLGKTIAIRVPISVVRAMLVNNSDEVDVDAGMKALAREGEVDVTVNGEKENVRVWTDTSATTD
jgi:hypothetical protein